MTASDLPPWLRPLADATRDVRAEDLTKALPPSDGTGRASAVLVALCAGPAVLLIERAADLRDHAGQVAFPGGALDPDDADAAAAALREAHEEAGLDPATVEVFATLPDLFIPVTGFVVTPVLGWWRERHPVAPVDPLEVARVVVVPIAELADPANRFSVSHPSGYVGPGFAAGGMFVWGFTAGLLAGVLDLGGWTQPWDPTRHEPLPADMGGLVLPP